PGRIESRMLHDGGHSDEDLLLGRSRNDKTGRSKCQRGAAHDGPERGNHATNLPCEERVKILRENAGQVVGRQAEHAPSAPSCTYRWIERPNVEARRPPMMPASGGTNQEHASLSPTNGQPIIGLS